ncbi:MAG: FxSxx-COOH system tetratricopeptide repeat protein [Ktedonobacteraceae bacterium]
MKNAKNDSKGPPNLRLHHAREERGWSQLQLAEEIGTTDVSISRWENGSTFPSSYFRQKLCEIFGKTLAELGLIPPPQSSTITPAELALISPPPQSSRIASIPTMRNPFFTGRADLLALLHKRLSTARTAALTQPQALYGLGGIGKTQTAAEYAFRYGDDYTGIFWIRAATRETLIADFVTLAQLLDLREKDGQDQSRIIAAVKRWLATHEDWLLILDNADDLPLAQAFLPTSHKGYILFTTRAQAAGTIAASVEVEKLDLHDGTLLLLRWSKLLDKDAPLDQAQASYRAVAERIVKEMDGLPLALVQVGAYVDETGCSLTDYLNLYAAHRKDLLARRSRLLLDYPETVATTWALSFQQIEQTSPAAADVLRLCAFLAADAIPEELLTRGAAALDAIPGAAIADAFKLNGALEVLRGYSLVRRDANTHMLSIHRLVQTVLKENMDQETQRAWAERTVRVVNAAFPEGDYGAGANRQYYLQYYLPHVQECASLIEQYHLPFPEAAELLYRTAAFLYFHGFHPQSQSFHQQALAIRKEVFGPDHPVVAESFNALAILARNQGNYEQAERFHLQALTIREKALGPQHLATAVSLNNLSVLYRDQGKYEQAEQFLQQTISIRERLLGSEHLNTLTAFTNLAKLYLEQRQYEQAESLLQQTLATSERVLDPAHLLIAQNLSLLAKLYFDQEDYEQAEPLWQRSLAILEKTLGSEHPATAERLKDLAELAFAQGRYAQAQSLCQKAIDICEKRLGPEHPDTAAYRKHLTTIITTKRWETG